MSKSNDPSVPSLKIEGSVNIEDFIQAYLAGPNKDKFNLLFENKFITPLLDEIQRKISTTSIKLNDIDLDKIVADFTSIDAATAAEFKEKNKKAFTDVNSKLVQEIGNLVTNLDKIDTQGIVSSFVSSLSKDLLSSEKSFIKMPEIKLPAINIPNLEPEVAKKYNDLAKTLINKIAENADFIKIDKDAGITYDNVLDVVFRNTPEYNNASTKAYQALVQKALTNITNATDKLSELENEEKYTQRDLFRHLFNQTPEMDLSASAKFNEARTAAITYIKESVSQLATLNNSDVYSQKDLFTVLFSRTPETSREAAQEFNKLKIAAIESIKPAIEKLSRLNIAEKYTQKDLFDSLFSQTPEMGMYASQAFNLLRIDGISHLRQSVSSLANLDTDKKFTQKDLFTTLFNQTPEMGLFSTLAFNSLRMDGILYLQNAVESLRDVDTDKRITQKDLFATLFNNTPEMGLFTTLKFNSLRISAIDILEKSLKSLELKLNDDSTLSQKNIIDMLFNKTPEMGFFTRLQYGDLVQTAIKKLKTSLNAIPDFQIDVPSRSNTDVQNKYISLSKETLDTFEIKVKNAALDAINKAELLADVEDTWVVENLKNIKLSIDDNNIIQKDNYKLLLNAIKNNEPSIIPTLLAGGAGAATAGAATAGAAAAGAATVAEAGTVAALVTSITGGIGALLTGTVLPALAVAAGGVVGWKAGEYLLKEKIESKSKDNAINYSPGEIKASQTSSKEYYSTHPEEAEKIYQQTGKYPFNISPKDLRSQCYARAHHPSSWVAYGYRSNRV